MSHVHVKLVGADTYNTLDKGYVRGIIYPVTHTAWQTLKMVRSLVDGSEMFVEASDEEVHGELAVSIGLKAPEVTNNAKPQRQAAVPVATHDMNGKPLDTGEQPQAQQEVPKAVVVGGEVDTAVALTEAPPGPSGHEGLDDDDTPSPEKVETPEVPTQDAPPAPEAPQVADPVVTQAPEKKATITINKKGPVKV